MVREVRCSGDGMALAGAWWYDYKSWDDFSHHLMILMGATYGDINDSILPLFGCSEILKNSSELLNSES